MRICHTVFKFERYGFLHEISMLENQEYLWQAYQKEQCHNQVLLNPTN